MATRNIPDGSAGQVSFHGCSITGVPDPEDGTLPMHRLTVSMENLSTGEVITVTGRAKDVQLTISDDLDATAQLIADWNAAVVVPPFQPLVRLSGQWVADYRITTGAPARAVIEEANRLSVARVRTLHARCDDDPGGAAYCAECTSEYSPWPCATIRALDGT